MSAGGEGCADMLVAADSAELEVVSELAVLMPLVGASTISTDVALALR